MALGRLRTALHYIGRRLREQPAGSITDRDLLVRFVRGHDQESFAGKDVGTGRFALAFSRDGKQLVGGMRQVRLWSLEDASPPK
jgi:hypothetical protein